VVSETAAGLAADTAAPLAVPESAAPFAVPETAAPTAAPFATPLATPDEAYPSGQMAVSRSKSGLSAKWLPYALAAGIGVVLLAVVFVLVTDAGGGSTANNVASEPPASTPVSESPEVLGREAGGGNADENAVYLIEQDGYVVLYHGLIGDTSQLERITDFNINELQVLSPDMVSRLQEGIAFDNMGTAETFLDELREQVESNRASVETSPAPPAPDVLYVCASDFVTLRTSPSISATAIVRINTREPVERLSESGGWTQINYNGQTGYVLSKFLSSDPNAPLNYDEW
jgi:hypothetical protein